MPTFNEQKGQGAFQPVLSNTAGVGPGGSTQPGKALDIAAGIASGAASVLDAFASKPLPPDVASPDLVANKADLEAELIGEVSLIADAPIPSGVFRQAKGDVDRVASAYRQGRMSSTEINTRLASIVQRYISTDPRNAEKYRDLARNVLGITPSEEILAERLEDIQFQQDQQRGIQQDEAEFAIGKGVVVPDGNGGVNVAATAQLGRQLRADEAKAEGLRDQIQLQKLLLETEKARQLTETERDRLEEVHFQQAVHPLLDTRLQGLYNSIDMLAQGPASAGMSREEQVEQISNSINVLQGQVQTIIGQTALSNGVRDEISQRTLNSYMRQFEAVRTMLTGDLSEFENLKRTAQTMELRDGAALREAMPTIVQYRNGLGDELTSSLVNVAVNTDPELKNVVSEDIQREILNFTKQGARVITGESDTTDMNPKERRAAAKISMRVIEELNKRPQLMNDNQRQSFKNANKAMVRAAMSTGNVQDRAKGVERLSSDRNLMTFDLLRANDPEVEEIGAELREANSQVFAEVAQRLQPDTTLDNVATALISRIPGVNVEPTGFTAAYDVDTGEVILLGSKGNQLRAVRQNPLIGPVGLKTDIDRANEILDRIARLKDYGRNPLGKMSEEEIRRAFAEQAGIRIVGKEEEDAR